MTTISKGVGWNSRGRATVLPWGLEQMERAWSAMGAMSEVGA